MADHGPYRRRAARVLLLDGTGRILLLRFHKNPAKPHLGHDWITPGGGVNDGESLQAAAARELGEEIGLVVGADELGPPVAYTSGHADLGWASGLFRDDFFCYWVETHEVDVSGQEARERKFHAGHQWWTVDELTSTTETIHPFGLAKLMPELLGNRIPVQPVQLPWHH